MQLDPQLLFYLQIAVTAVFAVIVLLLTYRHRKGISVRLKHWFRMARGKHVADDYLVYEGDDWDRANAPRRRTKAQWIDNLLIGDLIFGPNAVGALYMYAPQYFLYAAALVIGLPLVTQAWKYLRKMAEIELYTKSINMRIFYQTVDGREGEVVLERCRISDRITMKPRELLRALETAEHVIRSGIDERVLTAKIGKEYLTEGLKDKLDELEKLRSSRDQETRDAMTSVVVLRKYFSFGKDNPELQGAFDEEVRRTLDEIAQLMKTKSLTAKPEDLIAAYTGWQQKSAEATEKLKRGEVTPEIRPVLESLINDARAKDEVAKKILAGLDVVQKYYALGVLQEPGENEDLKRYEPHIYSVYPGEGDIKRRGVLIFPVPVGEAISKDSSVTIRLDYSVQDLNGSDLEAIRLDETLQELIVNGQAHHGIEVNLPEGVFAVPTNIPVFVITRADNTEAQIRQGQRITMPPALIGLFVKAVQSVIDYSWLAQKLSKAYARIRQLEEGEEEDKTAEETEQAQRDLDLGILIESQRPAEPPTTKRTVPPWQLLMMYGIGFMCGILALYLLIYMRWVTVPVYYPGGG